ncbi:hypothetical protein CFC21_034651 [Triticum aestivum]|uniref:Aquaporin n=3 Tax=Triticum TaxID=4564 RepID=A0A9R0RE43_TRITD|nr:hypothetical protein CFC21_034651 [Triticum aestivum]VAH58754.1 unnamed protein product [Triticum turgidum subsp. durum]
MEEGQDVKEATSKNSEDWGSTNNNSRCDGGDMISVQFMQKVYTPICVLAVCSSVLRRTNFAGRVVLVLRRFEQILAEILGTYFMILAGCGSVVVNQSTGGAVTFPGICVVWGLVVMVMVYSVGHVSGAHFNPAVTIAFATCRRFPWKQVPSYVLAQVLGSTLASLTLRLTFGGAHGHFLGTTPSGSSTQAVALEFIISFYLMFVVSGVATDDRAVGELAGLAVGATVVLNVLFAGYRPIQSIIYGK